MFKKTKVLSVGLAAALAVSGVASTNFGGSSNVKAASKELVIVSWGGALQEAHTKAFFKPFEKKYGVTIKIVSPPDYGKFKAMVQSKNVEWDVVDSDADFVPRAIKQNLLEPLDFKVIDKKDLDASLTTKYSVGSEIYAYGMAYDTEKFPKGKQPKTWKDFWNTKKFGGKRSLWKYAPGTLEAALLADGVSPKNLYPLDINRAFKSLDKLKKDVQVWWSTGAQPAQLLSDKEVTLAGAWNGRITTAKKQGAKEDMEFNQSILLADSWVIPKGAKNKSLAMKFIAFATSAKPQAELSKLIPYGPVNSKAYNYLSASVKESLATSTDKRKTQVMLDVNYWMDNYDKVNDRFQKWLLQ
jgi:putative spermidine/putrescine transport system substrate-binding protein